MDITPLVPKHLQVIEKYGDKKFTITKQEYEGSVFVFAENVISWQVTKSEEISLATLEPLLQYADDLEVVLIGGGDHHYRLPNELLTTFKEKNILIETMNTGAACRTFNVLLSEGRKVAAALVAID